VEAPDFESRRLARLQESDPFGEPTEFPLFGRVWRCVPLLPLGVMEAIDPTGTQMELTVAVLGMVRAALIEPDYWDSFLKANPIDPETLGELSTWLADVYGQRYKLLQDRQTAATRPPVFAAGEETPDQAHVRRAALSMAKVMIGGGEVAVPEDTAGYEAWELARVIAADPSSLEVWED